MTLTFNFNTWPYCLFCLCKINKLFYKSLCFLKQWILDPVNSLTAGLQLQPCCRTESSITLTLFFQGKQASCNYIALLLLFAAFSISCIKATGHINAVLWDSFFKDLKDQIDLGLLCLVLKFLSLYLIPSWISRIWLPEVQFCYNCLLVKNQSV